MVTVGVKGLKLSYFLTIVIILGAYILYTSPTVYAVGDGRTTRWKVDSTIEDAFLKGVIKRAHLKHNLAHTHC